MKNGILLYLILIQFSALAQEFSQSQGTRLLQLGIDIREYNLERTTNIDAFNKILVYDHKMKVNRNVSIVLTSIAMTSILSSYFFYNVNTGVEHTRYGFGIAALLWINAKITLYLSIPYWGYTYVRKRQRDKRIKAIQF